MARLSAGILLYRIGDGEPQVMLVHPGGPFWKNKDLGAWSIPKGEYQIGEDPLEHAKREFKEETGQSIKGKFTRLMPIKQAGGKIVTAFAVEGDIDVTRIKSNTIPIEWPPKSGKFQQIPEVDRGEWFDLDTARQKINAAQAALIDQLDKLISN